MFVICPYRIFKYCEKINFLKKCQKLFVEEIFWTIFQQASLFYESK